MIAYPSEAAVLTELTLASKNHWGYGMDQIEAWTEELTITEKYIQGNTVYKLTKGKHIIGYYSYFEYQEKEVELDNLFVLPSEIGHGYGRLLLEHFLKMITKEGVKKVRLFSEPKTEAFYQKFGFKTVGKKESSIPNRFLPIMEMNVTG